MSRDKDTKAHQARFERFRDQYERRCNSLLEQIEKAFVDVSREGGLSLHQAGALDDYFVGEAELKEAGKFDTDTHWSQIDVSELDPNGICLTYFDPIGFRYHLPAYMSSTIRSHRHMLIHEASDSDCDHSPTDKLSRNEPDDIENFRALNKQQSRCVARFIVLDLELGYLASLNDEFIRSSSQYRALTGYWRPFVDHADWKQLRSNWPKVF